MPTPGVGIVANQKIVNTRPSSAAILGITAEQNQREMPMYTNRKIVAVLTAFTVAVAITVPFFGAEARGQIDPIVSMNKNTYKTAPQTPPARLNVMAQAKQNSTVGERKSTKNIIDPVFKPTTKAQRSATAPNSNKGTKAIIDPLFKANQKNK